MDIVKVCADKLDNYLTTGVAEAFPNDTYLERHVKVKDVKAFLFNACTAALITTVALSAIAGSIFGMVFLGGCSFFGRKVVEESFHSIVPELIRGVVPGMLTSPKPIVSLGSIVLFYDANSAQRRV